MEQLPKDAKRICICGAKTDYYATPNGKIYSCKSLRFLKPSINAFGYLTVEIRFKVDDIKFVKRCFVHRLVAMAFIENIDDKPEVNHKDGNRQNNDVSNLEWVTSSENKQHESFKNPTGKYTSHEVHKACKMMESGKYTISDISEKLQLPMKFLYKIRNGSTWVNISTKYKVSNCKKAPRSSKNHNTGYNVYDVDEVEQVFILLEQNNLSVYDIEEITGVGYNTIMNILNHRCSMKYESYYEMYDIDKYDNRKPTLKPITKEISKEIAKIYSNNKMSTTIKYINEKYGCSKTLIRHYIIRHRDNF